MSSASAPVLARMMCEAPRGTREVTVCILAGSERRLLSGRPLDGWISGLPIYWVALMEQLGAECEAAFTHVERFA